MTSRKFLVCGPAPQKHTRGGLWIRPTKEGKLNMKSQNLRGLARNGLIAAAYAALSLALTPFTFGQVQCRVSEALTLLPVLCPSSVWGVTLGCVVTNLVGASAGTNFLGIADVFLGSAATLAAGLMTARLGKYRWKGLPVLASLPPVLLNAIVVGGEWCYVMTGGLAPLPFLTFGGFIALGQLVSCCGLGLVMIYALEKSGASRVLQ